MSKTADPTAPTRAGQLRDLLQRWWPGWRDVVSIIYLVTATFHLVANDGGRPYRPLLPLMAIGVVTMIATLPTLKATPRWLRLLALAWALGPLISLAFADVRAGWVRPVAAWSLAVPAALATLHVLRRRWGASAIAVIVGGSLAIAWFNGLLIWWGGGTARGEPAWMALSWHNQSGALMAVLGVGGLGVALASTRWPRLIGVVATAAGLSATWLSGSRGAVITAAAATIIVVLIAVRRPDEGALRRASIVAPIAIALTVVAVLALAPMWSGAAAGLDDGVERESGISGQPVTDREQDAARNLRARFGHWEAAVRMFATSPLTGTGPGSYQWSSRPVYPEDTNLTASAHGEQVEALGELGLLGGGAALAVTFGLAWLVLAAIRRPGSHPLEVAAAGIATHLAAHAAVDFDWNYPVLLALLAVAAGALVIARATTGAASLNPGDRPGDPLSDHDRDLTDPDSAYESTTTGRSSYATVTDQATDRNSPPSEAADRTLLIAVIIAALVLLGTGIAGVALQTRGVTPWTLDSRIIGTVTAAAHGDRPAVDERLSDLATWNPGAPRLDDVTALAHHGLGDLSDAELASSLDPETSAFVDQLQGASQLLMSGSPDLAVKIVEEARPVIDRRRAWGVTSRVGQAASIELTARHELGGCDAVTDAWTRIHPWLDDYGLTEASLRDEPVDLTGEQTGPAAWRTCELTTLRDD